MHGGEKLNGVKTAFVDIKMNIALFRIWRAGCPDLGFGVQSFHGKSSAIADAFAVFLRRNEKKLQLIVMSTRLNRFLTWMVNFAINSSSKASSK